jgi:hypothetical protein
MKPIPFSFGEGFADFEVLSIDRDDYNRIDTGQVYEFRNHPEAQVRVATIVDKAITRGDCLVKVKWVTVRE